MTETFRLRPAFAERVWGRTDLSPWYGATGTHEKVGEAWLTGPQSVVETGASAGKTLAQVRPGFPLLVKMLFPSDKLSVQVHPDDVQAQAIGLERGKTECWYVLEAEAGATVACGLRAGTQVEDVASAIAKGTLEDLMEMVPVSVGDMVFVDAGTVHAIGAGVTLLEVQQTSDTTYRLYDYGRPRELHLEAGLAVVKPETAAGKVSPRRMDWFTRLIEAKYFVVDRFDLAAGECASLESVPAGCLVGLAGQASVGEVEFAAGEAVVAGAGPIKVESVGGGTFVWCWEPI